MNKKGVTLVELLGAVVIMALMTSLIGGAIVLFNNASEKITIQSRANFEGNLLVRTIEQKLDDAYPTQFTTCGTNCVTLERHYKYVYNTVTQNIDLVLGSTPLADEDTLNVKLLNGEVLLDNVIVPIANFTLADTSSVSAARVGTSVNVVIRIDLLSSDNVIYPFYASTSFLWKETPVI
jgi:hypothetical protein